MSDDVEVAVLPVWLLATRDVTIPEVVDSGRMTPERLADLRTVLATLADAPVATLEGLPLSPERDRTGGIALRAASPLAQQLSQLVSRTAKTAPPELDLSSSGEMLYRMVVPAKVASQLGQGLVTPMASKAVAGGVYSGLRDSTRVVANAAFVPVTGRAVASGAAGASGAAAASVGVLTVAAPLVLMAVAVAVAAHADHQRAEAIEEITVLLKRLHRASIEQERNNLDGCRDAIDKATSILLDQGKIGHSLGLDSSTYEINKAIEATWRRVKGWQSALESLPPGPVEAPAIDRSFPGIYGEGGEFRAHLQIARLAIALKRRVLVLQAVEHAQLDQENTFETFVQELQDDERRLETLQVDLDSVLLQLSKIELKRRGGLRLSKPREVDELLRAAYRLRAWGDEVDAGSYGDVAIEIERKRDGSLIVFPAIPA